MKHSENCSPFVDMSSNILQILDIFYISRYFEYLSEHLKDKLMVNDVYSNGSQFDDVSTWEEKLTISQLFFLSEVG